MPGRRSASCAEAAGGRQQRSCCRLRLVAGLSRPADVAGGADPVLDGIGTSARTCRRGQCVCRASSVQADRVVEPRRASSHGQDDGLLVRQRLQPHRPERGERMARRRCGGRLLEQSKSAHVARSGRPEAPGSPSPSVSCASSGAFAKHSGGECRTQRAQTRWARALLPAAPSSG